MHSRLCAAACFLGLASAALAAPKAANAPDAETAVKSDFFFAALASGGAWLESPDYGYVWQPRVAAEKPDWRPYADGRWSQTDQGWTWISHEDFGWATYHYGRWAKLPATGWVWVPGYEWAPAWVAWRASPRFTSQGVPTPNRAASQTIAVESEELIGWAPLPPEAIFQPATGISPQVEVVNQIGPAAYNFVPAANFGEPSLLPWIYRPSSNFGFIASTVNCTNIAYRHGPDCIWVGGPDYATLRPVVRHPIAQLRLMTQAIGPAPPPDGYANQIAGDVFVVVAPRVAPPGGPDPRAVGMPVEKLTNKPTVTQPVLASTRPDRGWIGAPADALPTDALQALMKQQAALGPQIAIPPSASSPSVYVIKAWEAFPGPPKTTSRPRSKRPPATRAAIAPAIPSIPPPPKKPAAGGTGNQRAPDRGG